MRNIGDILKTESTLEPPFCFEVRHFYKDLIQGTRLRR